MLWWLFGFFIGGITIYLLLSNEIRVFTRQVSLSRRYKTHSPVQIRSADPALKHLAYETNLLLKEYEELLQKNHAMTQEHKQMTSSIAHDFRTPITSMLGYIQLLQETANSEKDQHRLKLVENRIQVLNGYIEDFYTLSLLSSHEYPLTLQDENPIRLLNEQLALYFDLLNDHFDHIVLDIDDTDLRTHLDSHALNRILSNLLLNACTHGFGTLSIQTQIDQKLFITITNNIDQEVDTARIFERSFKQNTVRTRGSSGLGLSIASDLAKSMNMSLEALTHDNTITFVLGITLQ